MSRIVTKENLYDKLAELIRHYKGIRGKEITEDDLIKLFSKGLNYESIEGAFYKKCEELERMRRLLSDFPAYSTGALNSINLN